MRTIQDVGSEILTNNPSKFYVFCGHEFGIKEKYIRILENYYGLKEEYPSVKSVLDIMQKKHIIPLQPKLYVIRYDENFISSLDAQSEYTIKNLNIIGTVVCIYEDDKHQSKLDKYLSNYTVQIPSVDIRFVTKYLHDDFPKLSDNVIDIVCNITSNYNIAYNMCKSLNHVDAVTVCNMSITDISNILSCQSNSDESAIKECIASKNFYYLSNYIDTLDTLDTMYYNIMSTMCDLDKIKSSKYSDSSLKSYADNWSISDIYNMFMHTYNELVISRSSNAYPLKDSLLYLFSLLQFVSIPSLEDMR